MTAAPARAGTHQPPPAGDAPLRVIKRRHPGRYVTGAVMLALLGSLAWGFSQGQVEWSSVPDVFTSDVMIQGAWFTVKLTLAAQGGAIVLGVVIAVMRISQNPVLKVTAWLFIWFFRGVPALLQILIWYNLALIFKYVSIPVPFTDLYIFNESTTTLMTAFVAALLGLGLNEAAYMAEIVRAGISSVDEGQKEAAAAIGLTPGQTLRRIVLPQALRVIIPPTGNDLINMLKATAIASVIGYTELVQASNTLSAKNLKILEAYFAAALWYMIVVTIASTGQYFIERLAAPSGARPRYRWNPAWRRRKPTAATEAVQ